MHPVVSF